MALKALIFDTETSGLSDNLLLKMEKRPEIIELYMCLVNLSSGKILSEFESIFKPRKEIDEEITNITGLTNKDLIGAKPFLFYEKTIRPMIESAPLVIAHNAAFDMEMVNIEFEREKRPKIKWPRALCTVEQTIYLKGFRMSLTKLHEYLFEKTFIDAHRAKADTMALVRCCVELHRRDIL